MYEAQTGRQTGTDISEGSDDWVLGYFWAIITDLKRIIHNQITIKVI